MSLYWKISIFSHDYTDAMAFGEEYHRGKLPFSSHHIECTLSTRLMTDEVDLDHLADQGSSTVLLPSTHNFHIVIFGRKSLCSPQ